MAGWPRPWLGFWKPLFLSSSELLLVPSSVRSASPPWWVVLRTHDHGPVDAPPPERDRQAPCPRREGGECDRDPGRDSGHAEPAPREAECAAREEHPNRDARRRVQKGAEGDAWAEEGVEAAEEQVGGLQRTARSPARGKRKPALHFSDPNTSGPCRGTTGVRSGNGRTTVVTVSRIGAFRRTSKELVGPPPLLQTLARICPIRRPPRGMAGDCETGPAYLSYLQYLCVFK